MSYICIRMICPFTDGPQPAILQKVSVPIWSNSHCQGKYGSAAPGGIIESMICAGIASRDSCTVSIFYLNMCNPFY